MSLVNHIAAFSTSGTTNPITTPAVDMTGATLLVAILNCNRPSGGVHNAVSDSSNNIWEPLTELSSGDSGNVIQMFYVFNPTVTSSQTFTNTPTLGHYPAICVLGFSGTLTTSSVFDAQSGAETANPTTTAAPGSITPAQAGEVFVTGAADNDSNVTISIDSSFNITDKNESSTAELCGAAYFVNTGSGALNPTWTFTNNTSVGINAVMAAFKPAAAALTWSDMTPGREALPRDRIEIIDY